MDNPIVIILLVVAGLGAAVFLGLNKMSAPDVCDGVTYRSTTASGAKIVGADEKRAQMAELNKKCFDDADRNPAEDTVTAPAAD